MNSDDINPVNWFFREYRAQLCSVIVAYVLACLLLNLSAADAAAWAGAIAATIAIAGSAAVAFGVSQREIREARRAEEDRWLVQLKKVECIVGQCQRSIQQAQDLAASHAVDDSRLRMLRGEWQRMARHLDESLLLLPDMRSVALGVHYLNEVEELIQRMESQAGLVSILQPHQETTFSLIQLIGARQQELLNYLVQNYTGSDAVAANRASGRRQLGRLRGWGDPT